MSLATDVQSRKYLSKCYQHHSECVRILVESYEEHRARIEYLRKQVQFIIDSGDGADSPRFRRMVILVGAEERERANTLEQIQATKADFSQLLQMCYETAENAYDVDTIFLIEDMKLEMESLPGYGKRFDAAPVNKSEKEPQDPVGKRNRTNLPPTSRACYEHIGTAVNGEWMRPPSQDPCGGG